MFRNKPELLLLCSLLFFYGFAHSFGGENEKSRFALLKSLIYDHTISIDRYEETTIDKAFFDGHFYSDKPPGIVFLALPAFSFASVLIRAGLLPGFHATLSWITTFGSVAILSALGVVALYLLLKRYVSSHLAYVTAFCFATGTLFFPYSIVLFSHAAVAGLLSIALYLSLREEKQKNEAMVAGLCLGLSLASEYSCGVIVIAIGFLALRKFTGSRMGLIGSAAMPCLLIPLYGFLCFDSPFALSYGNLYGWQEMNDGFFGITMVPSFDRSLNLLFSMQRGLLRWSPILLLSIPGLFELCKSDRTLCAMTIAACTVHLLLISSYVVWHGGAALGARHLTVVLPLLAIPTALGWNKFPKTGICLALVSVLQIVPASLISPTPPEHLAVSLNAYYLSQIARGEGVLTLSGVALGTPVIANIALLFAAMTCHWWAYGRITNIHLRRFPLK